MARPLKNNADYFPHDADMRNDPRVKALRRKFKLEGYAIYNLILEYLTDAEFFEAKVDKLGIELMAGDFDCSTELLESVLKYAIELGLIQSDNSILSCKSLDNRLEPLLSKRKRDRSDIIADDNTQSKVKESKEEKKKVEKRIEEPRPLRALPFLGVSFLNAWDEWETYRKQLKKKLTDSTAKKQIQFLGRAPNEEIAIAIIEQSIKNGWTGLFELNNNGNGKFKNTNSAEIIKPRTYADKL